MDEHLSLIPRELIAFAFVEDEYSKTGDIARGLMPLFTPILAKKSNAVFDPRWFASEVESSYDIPMSPLVAEGLVARLTDIGLLYQDSPDSHIFKISPHQKIGDPLKNQEVDDLLREFVEFAKIALNVAGYDIAVEIIENALLKRFTSLQFLSLLDRPDRNYFKGNTLSLKKSDDEPEEEINKEQLLDIVCANFALQMLETKPEKFELLAKIASGALIAEVVLTLQTPSPDEKLTETTVFLDGPLLLDYLDLSTVELREFAKDLFELIGKLQLKKCVFKHIIDEMKGTIYGPLESIQRGQLPFGPLGDRIRNDVQQAAYARAVYDGLEERLIALGIEVIDADDYDSEPYLESCSAEIEEGLRNSVGRVHENLERRIKDAKSIATILRVRGKKALHPQSITDAKCFLVTRNEGVAKWSRNFLIYKNQIDDRDFPPTLTDRQLAGLLWFSAGGSLAALSSKKLIANCSYVMHPRVDIVSKLRQCLTDIDPDKAEIFTVIIRDQRAQRCLVQRTFGFPSAISNDNAEQLLEEIIASTAEAERQAAFDREVQLKAQHEQEVQNISGVHNLELLEKDSKIFTLREQQSSLEEEYKNQEKQKDQLSDRISKLEKEYQSDYESRMSAAATFASQQTQKLKYLVILSYLLISFYAVAFGATNPAVQLVITLVLLTVGYWVIPDAIFEPLARRCWISYFYKQVGITNVTDKLPLYEIDPSKRTVVKK